MMWAIACAGLAAAGRFAIDPPRPAGPGAVAARAAQLDRAAEGYAVLFARRYLNWNAAEPLESQHALESYTGSGFESDAGLVPPSTGEQQVQWAEVVQMREPSVGEHVYTVAAQTDTAGLLYLTVPVQRNASGGLSLSGYPAFVGPPSSGPAHGVAGLREVDAAGLATVVQRALRNYLAGAGAELAADLTAGAQVSLPTMALDLESVQRLDWAPGGGAVEAVVQARDARGAQYTLAYELDVLLSDGRWELSAVQMDPDL
jgi:hypothetical protein